MTIERLAIQLTEMIGYPVTVVYIGGEYVFDCPSLGIWASGPSIQHCLAEFFEHLNADYEAYGLESDDKLGKQALAYAQIHRKMFPNPHPIHT